MRLHAVFFVCFPAVPLSAAEPPVPVSSETVHQALRRLPPPRPPRIPRIAPDKDMKRNLDIFFDALPNDTDSSPVMVTAPTSTPSLEEPAFDASWSPIAKGLWSGPKAQAAALVRLAARFQKAETPAGLSDDAPEALRLLALAISDRKGGKAAFAELNRELQLVADLKLEQKQAFASSLRSPVPAYVAVGASHAPHFTDAQAYFGRMTGLLAPTGVTLTQWMDTQDTEQRFAAAFLLRLHAYDALLPYLNRSPSEAQAMVPFLFSEKRSGGIRDHATQLEALTVQMAAYGRGSGAFDAFGAGLLERAGNAAPAVARRAALLLKLNAELWPRYAPRIAEAGAAVPDALLADPRLKGQTPYERWPEDRLAVSLHFPRKDSYAAWLRYFQARGYEVGSLSADGVELVKTVGAVTLSVTARMYVGDEEGFLKDAEKDRFLAAVSRDLRDPALQGVVVRTHAQFYYPALFSKKVTPGKLWLDGSCRGSWYAEDLERRCPTCAPIGNTATGMGELTNPVLYQVLEGMAARKDFDAIGADLKRALPKASSRFLGPWTPRYHTALDLLKSYPPPMQDAGTSR